jgi:hypothetical protein
MNPFPLEDVYLSSKASSSVSSLLHGVLRWIRNFASTNKETNESRNRSRKYCTRRCIQELLFWFSINKGMHDPVSECFGKHNVGMLLSKEKILDSNYCYCYQKKSSCSGLMKLFFNRTDSLTPTRDCLFRLFDTSRTLH